MLVDCSGSISLSFLTNLIRLIVYFPSGKPSTLMSGEHIVRREFSSGTGNWNWNQELRLRRFKSKMKLDVKLKSQIKIGTGTGHWHLQKQPVAGLERCRLRCLLRDASQFSTASLQSSYQTS